jgi:uncharacterized phage protein gp47/JayE
MITIPTTEQLYNSYLASLETKYGSTIPSFGKNFLRALALVQAATMKLFYLAIGKLQKNSFIDTADPEATGGTLERFGRIKLGRDPFPAAVGQYTITVTGTPGSTIPASTTFKSNDDSLSPGKMFVLDVGHVMATSSDEITVRALEAGTGSKLLIGDGLTATAPIIGVNRTALVDGVVVEPLAAEDIEDYRQKGLRAYRLEPNGGAASDFRLWADDAQGVKQVYPYAATGATAEVNLYVEANPADSTDGLGTPSPAMLAAVEAVVELDPDTSKPLYERGRRPLGIWKVNYLPVAVKGIDIEINGFVGLTPAIQSQIYNALKAQVDKVRPFVAAADILEEKNDILDTNKIISTILSVRPGSTFGVVELRVDGILENTHTFINGDIPYLNSVTYA